MKTIPLSERRLERTSERIAIASRLKEARVKAGVSQEKAARLLNLHRPAISAIEAGARRLAAEEILPMARLFGVSVSWLLDEANGQAPCFIKLE
jgi:transcriptional regulator with XRE-family HTH domain